jgi:hypothetical protein
MKQCVGEKSGAPSRKIPRSSAVKISVHEDCGNAPKKLFLRDFIVAVVKNNSTFTAANTTDDIHWHLVGGQSADGKPDVLAQLKKMRSDHVVELTVHTIVTHGYNGAANGEVKLKDGTRVAFCDVYQFRASTNNAPIKAITTYQVPLTAPEGTNA